MATYILRRLLYSIPVILVASFVLLWSVRATFDPCAQFRTTQGGAASVARCRASLHLDDSVFAQFGHWLGDAAQGNLGQSQQSNADVSSTLTSAFWYTIQLIFWGILVSAFLSIAL